jgi:RND family efflux transporter MFP subunit
MVRLLWIAVAGSALLANLAGAAEIEVPSVLVKLIEQVDVPAREAGVLEQLSVREGQMVKVGDPLAQIDDAAAKFAKHKAELELDGARQLSESDVKVRFARKSSEVAAAELKRALDSQQRLADSVSASELDQLRLLAEKATLEIEQAQLEFNVAKTARELKENDVRTAEHDVAQRRINAPIAGFVAQVHRHPGEWVEPGQAILRMLRLDRLRAEGLVSAQTVGDDLMGRSVTLTVRQGDSPTQYSGKIVFVSPEIDPVNGQVRVWAEIDNSDLKLRPGLHGSMVIADAEHAEP